MVETIIGIITGLVAMGLTALLNLIRSKLSAKFLAKVEKIASVVEQLYSGCPSTDKLAAFIDLCNEKRLNTAKAVEYLEKHIMPLSKEINAYRLIEGIKNDVKDTEVTN